MTTNITQSEEAPSNIYLTPLQSLDTVPYEAPQSQTQTTPTPAAPETVPAQEMSAPPQLDLSMLDIPETPAETAPAEEKVTPTIDADAFAQALQSQFGITTEQLAWGVKYVQQAYVREAETRLQQIAGEDVTPDEIVSYWAKLPPQTQALFDTPEGAELIRDRIRLDKMKAAQQTQAPRPIDRSTTLGNSLPALANGGLTEDIINKMSDADKQKNWQAILAFYQNKR